MRDLFNDFIREKRYLNGVSENTIRSYEMSFQKFENYAQALDKKSLNDFVIGLRKEGGKPGGCNVRIRSINSFLSWCYENGHTSENLRIKQIKQGQPIIKVFSDTHIQALLNYKPKDKFQFRAWAITCLLIDSGCRISEALDLKVGDIDLEQLMIIVRGKGDKERYIPISRELRKILWRYQKRRISSDYFFSTRGGRMMYRNYVRDLKVICTDLGISGVRISPHSFRHYFAINALRSGIDLFRLSRILGHSSIALTQQYLRHMGIEPIREAHSAYSPLSRL